VTLKVVDKDNILLGSTLIHIEESVYFKIKVWLTGVLRIFEKCFVGNHMKTHFKIIGKCIFFIPIKLFLSLL